MANFKKLIINKEQTFLIGVLGSGRSALFATDVQERNGEST